jgi:hypothetical protein
MSLQKPTPDLGLSWKRFSRPKPRHQLLTAIFLNLLRDLFATGQIPANKVQYKACVKNENPASAGLKTAGDRSGPGDIDTSGFSIIYEQKFLSIMENVKA